MARIDDLLDALDDQEQATRIRKEIEKIRRHRKFGLVFEAHEPETVTTRAVIRIGSEAMLRKEPGNNTKFLVEAIEKGQATIVSKTGERREVPVEDLLAVLSFEDPIVPGLTHLGGVRRSEDRPAHAVINGENFHALHALLATHAGKVDVIYIDPPYNTGDKSWKYNNRFVDDNDTYAHSKWLSFMEKRLKLAKELLKDDGVLIVTIDEHEVHHLGVLLEQVFQEADIQMITIVNNRKGVAQGGFARVEEYAQFVLPRWFHAVDDIPADLLFDVVGDTSSPWISLLRRGNNSQPADRPNLCYPIAVDPKTNRVVGTGRSLKARADAGEVEAVSYNQWEPPTGELVNGHPVLWPRRSDGRLGTWGVGDKRVMKDAALGFVRVSTFNPESETGVVNRLSSKSQKRIESKELEVTGWAKDGSAVVVERSTSLRTPKRVWNRVSHDAGTYGSSLLTKFLGRARTFSFPKSLYAVSDTLATVCTTKPSAIILDFFAGSGTTLHATALLNARDGGNRQCILVTNNDVSDSESKRLNRAGHFVGDPEFEAHGIFEAVTKPRVEAAINGKRPDGTPVPGNYLEQYLPDHAHADGFEENVEFFRLDYLSEDMVRSGAAFSQIIPLLWMQAGSVGEWEADPGDAPWSMPVSSNYAVLFNPDRMADFLAALSERDDVTHVWVDTTSQAIIRQVRSAVRPEVHVARLYDDYLRNVERRPRRALQ